MSDKHKKSIFLQKNLNQKYQTYRDDMFELQKEVRYGNWEKFQLCFQKCIEHLKYEITIDEDDPWIVDYSCDFDFTFASSLKYGHLTITQYIIDNYENPLWDKINIHYCDDLALRNAIKYKNTAGVNLLLTTNSMIGFGKFLHDSTSNDFAMACEHGLLDIAKILMTHSLKNKETSVIDPKKSFSRAITIMSCQNQTKHLHVIRWLIDLESVVNQFGIDSDIQDTLNKIKSDYEIENSMDKKNESKSENIFLSNN